MFSRLLDPGAPRKGRRTAARSRREDVARRVREMLRDPSVGWGLVTGVVFVVACTLAGIWAGGHPLVAVGRVMDHTWAARIAFSVPDLGQTERNRDEAQRTTPRIFVAESAAIAELSGSIANLPRTLAGVTSLDQVDPSIREAFALDEQDLQAVLAHAEGGEPDEAWRASSATLTDLLFDTPIVDREVWQRFTQESPGGEIIIRAAEREERRIPSLRVINVTVPEDMRRAAESLANRSGFTGRARNVVADRLALSTVPTYKDDQAATRTAQQEAAAAVPQASREISAGEILFRRGEILGQASALLVEAEIDAFHRDAEAWRITPERLALGATIGGVTVGLAGYIAFFCPRIRRNPTRAAALALLGAGTVWVSAFVDVFDPRLAMIAMVVPTVLTAMVLVVAYDQRTGLALGAGLALITGLVLGVALPPMVLTMVGVGVAVWQLREIRERHTLIRAGVMLAICLGGGGLAIAFVTLPVSLDSLRQALTDGAFLCLGGLTAAGIILFILPLLERAFDITTGLTLIELRDPKHPLLRELQQRAPGTYNHSLNVAAISEAAAGAIGADALLTYVGCLYHDVGKMTKPEYFVENQGGGPNKHDRLSPAMSLLVIVGHVKDGMEMAKQHNLPRAIEHFIEAHHGTTLVEFFYRRAVEQAKGDGSESIPEELAYRYPGPKPRTREVAIAMLSDAVESATRTLHEPTPSRIDALVRTLANKRLMDGQFDDCDLTLKQLQAMVESISKSVAAIYHGRIAYPGGGSAKKKTTAPGVATGAGEGGVGLPASQPAETRAAKGA